MSSLLRCGVEAGWAGLVLLAMAGLWSAVRLPSCLKRVGSADRALAHGLIGAVVGFSLWSILHWTVELPAVAISASALGGTWNRWLAGGTDLFVDRGVKDPRRIQAQGGVDPIMPESTCLHIQDRESGPIRVVELPWISVRIGRAAFCEVRLADPDWPTEACRLTPRGEPGASCRSAGRSVVLLEGRTSRVPAPCRSACRSGSGPTA